MRTEKLPRLKAISAVSSVLASRRVLAPLAARALAPALAFADLAATPEADEPFSLDDPFNFEPRARTPFSAVTLFMCVAPHHSKIPYGQLRLWQSFHKTQLYK